MDLFYDPQFTSSEALLDKAESHHCLRVLRNKVGSTIGITNGLGTIWEGIIAGIEGNCCRINILQEYKSSPSITRKSVAISPTKSGDRTEWFVEKSTEMGITDIFFILCEHSERKKINLDRLGKKAISAIKQSKNPFLPILHPLLPLPDLLKTVDDFPVRFLAHQTKSTSFLPPEGNRIILVGPEGGFTAGEIDMARESGFADVSLGNHILRTETAGILGLSFISANH